MTIQDIIAGIKLREGGYVDHPSDKGGPTNWGITEAVARAEGWHGAMQDLPWAFAEAIYLRKYVTAPGFDKVAALNISVAEELVDSGVNVGPANPSMWLQHCLNLLNRRATAWPELTADGIIGPATLSALGAFLAQRGAQGQTVLLRMLNSLQGAYYITITDHREANEDFIFGWFANRVEIK